MPCIDIVEEESSVSIYSAVHPIYSDLASGPAERIKIQTGLLLRRLCLEMVLNRPKKTKA